MHTWLVVLALLAPAAAQSDLKNPQPALDEKGRAIPGNFTVSICRGTFFDMTPRNGGRDRYTTPHDVRVTRTTGTSARGGSQGTNGTIRFTSGAPGIQGSLGETTIEYDIIEDATRTRVQHVIVKVKVIDCPPPSARGGGDNTVPATPETAGPRPPANRPAQGQAAQRPPASNRQATHRTTSCGKCQSIAAALNAAADKGDTLAVAALSKELNQCELNCRLDEIAEKVDWRMELQFGAAFPISQLGREASTGFTGKAAAYRYIDPAFSVGFRFDISKFRNAAEMPDDFSASRTTMSIDTVYSFNSWDDNSPIEPFVSAGAGMSRNTLNFGESSASSWKLGFGFGAGASYDVGAKTAVAAEVRYSKFGTFSDISASIGLAFSR